MLIAPHHPFSNTESMLLVYPSEGQPPVVIEAKDVCIEIDLCNEGISFAMDDPIITEFFMEEC